MIFPALSSAGSRAAKRPHASRRDFQGYLSFALAVRPKKSRDRLGSGSEPPRHAPEG